LHSAHKRIDFKTDTCNVICLVLYIICNLKACQYSVAVINTTIKLVYELEILKTGVTHRSVQHNRGHHKWIVS